MGSAQLSSEVFNNQDSRAPTVRQGLFEVTLGQNRTKETECRFLVVQVGVGDSPISLERKRQAGNPLLIQRKDPCVP